MKNIISAFLLLLSGLLSGQNQQEVKQDILMDQDTVRGSLLSQYPLNSRVLKKHPLVVIIPGSGPTDRDGNSSMIPGPNDAYKLLADSLLAHGIASFRYDKPGVGESSFSKKENELRFEDNVAVINAILAKMQDLGFKKIFLFGHSEGSLSGMLAAQEGEVNGFISAAGMGRNMHDILIEQLEKQLSGEILEATLADLDSIEQGEEVKQYNPLLAGLLRPSVQPYLHSAFKYDPTEELKELEVPVLIIQGGYDLQVPESDGAALSAAVPEATYKLYPEMNHVLKTIDGSMKQNQAAYMDPDFPLHQAMINDLVEWINSHSR